MQIVPYCPELFQDLLNAVNKMQRGFALSCSDVVNHYYHDNPWGLLHLAVAEDGHSILGTIGSESIPFLLNGNRISISFGSNFHTIEEGCGGLLFMKWTRSNPHLMVYNCSVNTQRLITAQRWNPLDGIQTLTYNAPAYHDPSQPTFTRILKASAKRLLRKPPLGKVVADYDFFKNNDVDVSEVAKFQSDMLGFESSFDFRVEPSVDYLNWRFPTDWKPFKYRIFSIKRAGRNCGFIVLHEAPHQVCVAHSDAETPLDLCRGMLLALITVSGKKPSLICSSVPEVTKQLIRIGFRAAPNNPRVQFSRNLSIANIERPLINFSMGDNDLRTEFLQNG